MHFNYDSNLIFYLAGCIFFLLVFISKRKPKPKNDKLISLQNEVNKLIDDKKVKKWPLK